MDHQVEHDGHVGRAAAPRRDAGRLEIMRPAHARLERLVDGGKALDVPDLEHEALPVGQFDQLLGLGHRLGDGLLDQQVDARFHQVVRHGCVKRGRHGEADGVDAADQLAMVGDRVAAVLLRERAGHVRIGVAHGDQIAGRARRVVARVEAPEISKTDDGRAYWRGHVRRDGTKPSQKQQGGEAQKRKESNDV